MTTRETHLTGASLICVSFIGMTTSETEGSVMDISPDAEHQNVLGAAEDAAVDRVDPHES